MVNNLQEVGIRAKLRPIERAAFIKGMARRSINNLIQGGSGAFGNAATRLEAFVVKGGAYVYGSYPDIDELFVAAGRRLDRANARRAAAQDAAAVHERTVYAPIWQLGFLNGRDHGSAEVRPSRPDPGPSRISRALRSSSPLVQGRRTSEGSGTWLRPSFASIQHRRPARSGALGAGGRGLALVPRGMPGGGAAGPADWVASTSRWRRPGSTRRRPPGIITPFMVLYALHDAMVKPMPDDPMAPCLAESWSASRGRAELRLRAAQGRASSTMASRSPPRT